MISCAFAPRAGGGRPWSRRRPARQSAGASAGTSRSRLPLRSSLDRLPPAGASPRGRRRLSQAARASFPRLHPSPLRADPLTFIRASGQTFVDGACHAFPVSGYNSFGTIEAAIGARSAIDAQFKAAAAANLTVARVFAHPVKEGLDLQTAPGVFNDAALAGLDYMIASAGAHGVRLLISLVNNWWVLGPGLGWG